MYAYRIKHKINNYNNNNYKNGNKKPVRKNTIEETLVIEVQTWKRRLRLYQYTLHFCF